MDMLPSVGGRRIVLPPRPLVTSVDVPSLSDLDLRPSLLLAMWTAGMAVGIAVVAWWRVVGPAYLWVAGGSALLAGAFAAFGGPWAAAGAVALVAGVALAKRPRWAAPAFALSGVAYLVHASALAGPLTAVTGAVALGGVTCEMLLGHWYLVDPSLPRWALRRLDVAGGIGLVADMVVIAVAGAMASGAWVLEWAWLGLGAFSILLMVGVWFSIKEEGYEGVMAATGLSYLAVLTSLGSVALGRILLQL
jgi:hypothetical protein